MLYCDKCHRPVQTVISLEIGKEVKFDVFNNTLVVFPMPYSRMNLIDGKDKKVLICRGCNKQFVGDEIPNMEINLFDGSLSKIKDTILFEVMMDGKLIDSRLLSKDLFKVVQNIIELKDEDSFCELFDLDTIDFELYEFKFTPNVKIELYI